MPAVLFLPRKAPALWPISNRILTCSPEASMSLVPVTWFLPSAVLLLTILLSNLQSSIITLLLGSHISALIAPNQQSVPCAPCHSWFEAPLTYIPSIYSFRHRRLAFDVSSAASATCSSIHLTGLLYLSQSLPSHQWNGNQMYHSIEGLKWD